MNEDIRKKMSLILDNSGAIYMGLILSETNEHFLVFNPAQVFTSINEESKDIEVTIIPVCFPELLSPESKTTGTSWKYKKENARFISAQNVIVDDRVLDYYFRIFNKNES
jgi:hypothetical protein